MDPLMPEENKRAVSAFVPYRRTNDSYEFYLQKRDATAPSNPGMMSFFGGGIEDGESSLDGLLREVEEELVYKPENLFYFSKYETQNRIFHIFIEEVEGDFESLVQVQEGEYGAFLSLTDVESAPDVSPLAKFVIIGLLKYLEN